MTSADAISRRKFLRTGAYAAAISLLPENSRAAGVAASPRAWRTDTYRKHASFELDGWKPRSRNNVADLIVDDRRSYQPILRLGATLTDSSCCLLSRMSTEQRDAFLHKLYAPSAMNLSVGRCCIATTICRRT